VKRHWPQIVILLKVFIATVSTVGLIVGTFFFLKNSIFQIRQIEIELEQNAAHPYLFPKIQKSLEKNLAGLHGEYIWKVNLEKVLDKVSADLRVKDAKITRVLPQTIRVVVSPYTPIANVMTKTSDRLYPIARDGEILPAVPVLEAPDAPLLRGQIFLKDKSVRLKAIELMNALPETGRLSLHATSEISYDTKTGFKIRLSSSRSVVWMGFDDFATRISQAKRVVDYLETHKLSGRIIDARFGKKVVVKLRNEP